MNKHLKTTQLPWYTKNEQRKFEKYEKYQSIENTKMKVLQY